MGKPNAPNLTPAKGGHDSGSPDAYDIAKQQFYASALNMSWQLAVAVLVPVIGGFKLDQHLHSAPLYTLIGFVVAIIAMFIICKRALTEYSVKTSTKLKGGSK